jgi:predicted Zn-ribbon and HTH transcriptional regulator
MSFVQKLKERTEQMYAAIEDALDGDRVSEDVRNQRLAECNKCEHLYAPTQNCKQCGCFVRAKVWLPSQYCPIHKWEAVTLDIAKID